MTVRTPLKLDGSDLKEMSTADINSIIAQCMYQYSTDPSVDLTYVASGGGLGSIGDSRFISGAASQTTTGAWPENTTYPDEATTAEPTITTVNYARMTQTTENTRASVDTNSVAFPVYKTGDDIHAMTLTDMYDTFVYPAIDLLVDGNDRPGTYRIHTATTLTGHTNISTTPVFTDSKADVAGMTAGEIGTSGTTQTDATNVTNYYLFRTDGTAVTYPEPVFATTDGNLQAYTIANFDALLKNCTRHVASEVVGSRIRYGFSTGANRGSGMVDSRISSTTGTYTQREASADDYRAQEFPAGSATTQSTTFLKIRQE
jgi:hypothetical protein